MSHNDVQPPPAVRQRSPKRQCAGQRSACARVAEGCGLTVGPGDQFGQRSSRWIMPACRTRRPAQSRPASALLSPLTSTIHQTGTSSRCDLAARPSGCTGRASGDGVDSAKPRSGQSPTSSKSAPVLARGVLRPRRWATSITVRAHVIKNLGPHTRARFEHCSAPQAAGACRRSCRHLGDATGFGHRGGACREPRHQDDLTTGPAFGACRSVSRSRSNW